MARLDALREFGSRLTRKKMISTDVMETNLRRCLGTADITLLAIGHMVGSGVYVLTATAAHSMAGPAIALAFLLSGVASFLAALCYAELGVRYPRSGSAYSYTYLALGELWAFLVGWNVALEHVIAGATVSRACSAYIDSLAEGAIKNATMSLIGPIDVPLMSDNLDFLALGIMLFFIAFLSLGVKMTSVLNNVFSVINLIVILIIIGVGGYFSDASNWTNQATGGFMPFGFTGVLAASASCFYAFVGFDSIAAAGEEARDPQKSIPRATMISMTIATVAYVSVSIVLTMMVNYKDIEDDSGLPDAFALHGAYWAKYVVIVGAVCGMSTALIGSLFALTRVIYVMADDGLLFGFCSRVNGRTQVPLGAMYIFAGIAAILTLVLDINTLVEVMSIGTLFAYMVVSASVIILRYRPNPNNPDVQEMSFVGDANAFNKPRRLEDPGGQLKDRVLDLKDRLPFINSMSRWRPGKLVVAAMASFVAFTFVLCGFVIRCSSQIADAQWWAILLTILFTVGVLTSLGVVACHKESSYPLRYKVPLIPLVPALSVFVNAILIVNLQAETWLRLVIWVAVGLLIYFGYGIRNSTLGEHASLLRNGSVAVPQVGSFDHQAPVSAYKEHGDDTKETFH